MPNGNTAMMAILHGHAHVWVPVADIGVWTVIAPYISDLSCGHTQHTA